MSTAIRNARARFANGKHQAAIQLLEGLSAASNPLVSETLREFRTEFEAIQERRRAEQAIAEQQRLAVLADLPKRMARR